MENSKWGYIVVGGNTMGAFFGALIHSTFCLIFCFVLAVINWYIAEHKRHIEEKQLLAEYELLRQKKSDDEISH
jgi:uncharacterized membrane protein